MKKYTIEELLFRKTISIDNPNVINAFTNKTILVTGGAGSIGSEIVNQLATFNPTRIIIVDQAETPLNSIQLTISAAFPNVSCHFELVDVTSAMEVQQVFQKYQSYAFHQAFFEGPEIDSHQNKHSENLHRMQCRFLGYTGSKDLH